MQWSIITAGFALAIAAFGGALGQGRAIASAAEAIARNPGAAGEIRGVLILGLVLIESLVIYVLLVTLILFFIKPFGRVVLPNDEFRTKNVGAPVNEAPTYLAFTASGCPRSVLVSAPVSCRSLRSTSRCS